MHARLPDVSSPPSCSCRPCSAQRWRRMPPNSSFGWGRLESQSRTMSGQIETLQYENRQLKEQLRKFQEDVEFRLNEKGGGGAAAAAKPARSPAPSAAPAPAAPNSVNGGNPGFNGGGTRQPSQKRGDAFDPDQNPEAPGAPMRLGATEPSAPLPPRETAEAAPLPRGRPRRRGRGHRLLRRARRPEPAAPHGRDPLGGAAPQRERRRHRHAGCRGPITIRPSS